LPNRPQLQPLGTPLQSTTNFNIVAALNDFTANNRPPALSPKSVSKTDGERAPEIVQEQAHSLKKAAATESDASLQGPHLPAGHTPSAGGGVYSGSDKQPKQQLKGHALQLNVSFAFPAQGRCFVYEWIDMSSDLTIACLQT
jgi:hypothetical protein